MPDLNSLAKPSQDLPCPFTLPLFPDAPVATAEAKAPGPVQLTFPSLEGEAVAEPVGPSDDGASRCAAPPAPEWLDR